MSEHNGSYYEPIRRIKIIKVPIKLLMKYWIELATYLMPFSKEMPMDGKQKKCWRAALSQILIKVGEKQEKFGKNPDKLLQISLSPAEKFALEELLFDTGVESPYVAMIFQQIINQIDAFEVNRGMRDFKNIG